MDISVIIPLYNEAESLPELYAWITRVMAEHGYSYEIIFVNDGSTDDSWNVIEGIAAKDGHVCILRWPAAAAGHQRPGRDPARVGRQQSDDHLKVSPHGR